MTKVKKLKFFCLGVVFALSNPLLANAETVTKLSCSVDVTTTQLNGTILKMNELIQINVTERPAGIIIFGEGAHAYISINTYSKPLGGSANFSTPDAWDISAQDSPSSSFKKIKIDRNTGGLLFKEVIKEGEEKSVVGICKNLGNSQRLF